MTVLAAALLSLAAAAPPAAQATSESFRLSEKDLIPESVAYDPADGAFYVGSMHKRKIVKVAKDGRVTDFVGTGADGLWGVVGMKLDPGRRELWANTCNPWFTPPMVPAEPAGVGRTAVMRYDVRTGRLLKKYAAGGPTERVCFNDLALAPNGDVYLSAGLSGVYRIRRDTDRLEVVGSPFDFVNGIAVSPDGKKLYIARSRGPSLMDMATGKDTLLQVPAGTSLTGIDGLYVYKGSLVGVQNGRDPMRVVQAFLDDLGERVTCVATLEEKHPLLVGVPTTGVVVGADLHYVANSQLDAFEEGKLVPKRALDESVVLRTALLDACPGGPAAQAAAPATDARAADVSALLALHAAGRRAHFAADADALMADAGDAFVSVSGGKIQRSTRDQDRAFFQGYFEGATYTKWDDLEPPIVRVSADGTMAWVITRLEVDRVQRKPGQPDAPRRFVYAGIMTYEKKDGRWVRVANVSTFE